jgi:hypothetical protein
MQSESARFQEKQLSLKEQAIRKSFKIITSRVNETNIDRLATRDSEGSSSFCCWNEKRSFDICTKMLTVAGATQKEDNGEDLYNWNGWERVGCNPPSNDANS